MSYVRIAIAVLAVVAAALLAWRVTLSFTQAAEIEALQRTVGALERAEWRDNRISAEMRTFRAQQHADMKAFDATLAGKKFVREVHYVTETGEPAVRMERDRELYRQLHNEATTGAADLP